VLVAAVLLIIAGARLLFPPVTLPSASLGPIVAAEVVAVRAEDPVTRQQTLDVRVLEGNAAGRRIVATHLTTDLERSGLRAGDTIYVLDADVPGQAAFVVDVVRLWPLAILAIVVAIVTVAMARWQGVGALIGLAMTLLVLAGLVIPGILNGANPVLMAVIGSFLILAVTLFLAHGFTIKAWAALAGTGLSLLLTALVADVAVNMTRLTGVGTEEGSYLFTQTQGSIDVVGLLLAGIIIGAVGALNDSAISQSSAVTELRDTDPSMSRWTLFERAMRIGRDHIASSIYTLVLAYVGAALPLFLLVALSADSLGVTLNREFIAEELVRTMVGTLGLLACVPLTTGVAAFLEGEARSVEPV
jgi:uncharacterized membrane protein